MKKLSTTGLFLFGIFILTTIIAFAAVPQQINYQGRLMDSAGDPVNDGLYHIKFAIYDAPIDGTELWVDTFRKIGVNNGLFSTALGSMSAYPLPDNLFTDTSLYLGVTVQGESEMTPRTRLLTVPFSYHSLRADTAGSVDWTDIDDMPAGFADGTDDVGIEPVAYGYIKTDATVEFAYPAGVTCTWNAVFSRYEITIPGEYYSIAEYATAITPVSDNSRSATSDSMSGKLIVFIYDSADTKIQSLFHFIVFKM